MLHEETVEAGTLALIRRLMADENLADFYLVGGTALSLKLGHRISIDIDLFIGKDFDSSTLTEHLKKGVRTDRRKNGQEWRLRIYRRCQGRLHQSPIPAHQTRRANEWDQDAFIGRYRGNEAFGNRAKREQNQRFHRCLFSFRKVTTGSARKSLRR
jgi:hypothetical protein